MSSQSSFSTNQGGMYGNGPGPAPSLANEQEAQRNLSRTQQRISQTQEQLEDLRRQRSNTPRTRANSSELDQKDRYIAMLSSQVARLEQQLQRHETVIGQMRATIRTQSKTIENSTRGLSDNASVRQQTEPQPYGQPAPGSRMPLPPPPPPSFNAYQTRPTGLTNHPPPGLPMPVHRPPEWSSPLGEDIFRANSGQQSERRPGFSRVNDVGSPAQLRPFPGAQHTPGRGSGNSMTGGTPSSSMRVSENRAMVQYQQSGMSQAVPMPPSPQAWDSTFGGPTSRPGNPASPARSPADVLVEQGLQTIFERAVQYAYQHCNFPSNHQDKHMPREVKDRLLGAGTATVAHKVMSSQHTRYFLVAKVMLEWIIANVLKKDAFAGMDATVDEAIRTARAQMWHSTPRSILFIILESIAKENRKLVGRPNWSEFVNVQCRKRAEELWGIVKPMMHQKTSGDWDELYFLMERVYNLAQMMQTGTDQYRYEFPPVEEIFDPQRMLNVDPEFKTIPDGELVRRRGSVRLAYLPFVAVRKTSPLGDTTDRTIHKSRVLIKWAKVAQ